MEDHGWKRVGTARLGTASRGQWTAKRGLARRGHSGTLHGGGVARRRIATAQHSQDCPTQRRLCNQWLRQTTSRNCGGLAHQRSPVRGWGIATNGRESREQGKAKHDIAGATHSFASQRRQSVALHWRSSAARGQRAARHSESSDRRSNERRARARSSSVGAKA